MLRSLGLVGFLSILLASASSPLLAAEKPPAVPIKGMVTMVDLGAAQCIPCKMMAPILVKLEKEYAGRAAIVFIDSAISGIPTQIFFDKDCKEVYRHLGFFNEEGIIRQINAMGVK